MKKFLTVFKFTYMKSIRNMEFVVITLLGIMTVGLFFNYPKVISYFDNNMVALKEIINIDKTNLIAVMDSEKPIGISQNILDSYPGDNCEFYLIYNKNVDAIKDEIKNGKSKYSALLLLNQDKDLHIKLMVREDASNVLLDQVNTFVQSIYLNEKAKELNLSSKELIYLKANANLEVVDLSSNEAGPLYNINGKHGEKVSIVIMMICAFYFISILNASSISRSIVEEKSNRIQETLITMTKPIYLFLGKILGLCSAVITQLLILILSGCVFSSVSDISSKNMPKINIPPNIVLYFVIFILLSYLLYAFVYGAVGSLFTDTQDTTQVELLIMLANMILMFIAVISTSNVNSTYMKVLSYIPLTSPVIMFERIVLTEISTIKIIISIAILIFAVIGTAMFSSKLYKKGVLHYSRKLSFIKLIKTVISAE
ncbi:ABC transporter permease [Clostridium tagluense]|uniref:ABC transporter permease n=1 Tax=Clostridium tagluense TaxID=360422 RepID=UPI001C0DAF3B|nr:ABC transporter permease [Clostridium tagluense]MBU3130208.1 ABC transporter permease [Clostridium tagluense]